jgi:hypothetical protein
MKKINWVPHDGGYLGILPCVGLTVVLRLDHGKHPATWHVSFGTARLDETFEDLADARAAGVVLARRVLTECLVSLEAI